MAMKKINIIACENIIGGSEALRDYVYADLTADKQKEIDVIADFPNVAVDRIIPMQTHEDLLFRWNLLVSWVLIDLK